MFENSVYGDMYFNLFKPSAQTFGYDVDTHAVLPLRRNEDGETITAIIDGNGFNRAIQVMGEKFNALIRMRRVEFDSGPRTVKYVIFRDIDRPFFSRMLGMLARNEDISEFVATLPV